MSDITKKFDLQGIIGNVKSIISPAGNTPSPNPDDALGLKIAELSTLVQQLATDQAEQSKALTKVNKLLNGVFQDVEALRNPPEAPVAKEAPAAKAAPAVEKAEAAPAPAPEAGAPEEKAN